MTRLPSRSTIAGINPFTKKRVRVLLVEDNPADSAMFRMFCAPSSGDIAVTEARDGRSAIGTLEEAEPFQLIILDIGLPDMKGFEVLTWIRNSQRHRLSPVVVLSGSSSPADVNSAYELRASCFIQKPADVDAFERLCSDLMSFWLDVARIAV